MITVLNRNQRNFIFWCIVAGFVLVTLVMPACRAFTLIDVSASQATERTAEGQQAGDTDAPPRYVAGIHLGSV